MVAKRVRSKLVNQSVFQKVRGILSSAREKKEAILPYSKASEDSTVFVNADTTHFNSFAGKLELEVLYRNNWAIWKAINVRANLLTFRGLKIKAEDPKALKVTNEFLKLMHPTRPELALLKTFKNRSINTDVFGNSYDELLFEPRGTREKPADPKNATSMVGFTVIHPLNIDYIRDQQSGAIKFKDNVPKGWRFVKDAKSGIDKGIELPLGRVGHLKYNEIGDELIGISTLEPIFKTGERLLKIEEGVTQGILTHGNPLHDVIVGDESHPPTKKMIDTTAKEVAGLNMKSEYVHPPWIRVGQIESFSLGKSPNYMQPFITAIAAATGVPEFILLGRGEGTNKATAQAMINFIHQTIEPLQQAQAMYFEEAILAPLMKIKGIDEVPMIEWNEILPRNPTDYAEIVKIFSEVMIGGKPMISMEEGRELAGLGPKVVAKEKGKTRLTRKLNFKK